MFKLLSLLVAQAVLMWLGLRTQLIEWAIRQVHGPEPLRYVQQPIDWAKVRQMRMACEAQESQRRQHAHVSEGGHPAGGKSLDHPLATTATDRPAAPLPQCEWELTTPASRPEVGLKKPAG